jgi:hypothetical protein
MSVRLPLLARRLHKWLGLILGVQLLIWMASGLYMTAIHIDVIHGDRFIREAEPAPLPAARLADPLAAAAGVPRAESVRLGRVLERPVYIVGSGQGSFLIDAVSGTRLARPDEREIRRIADYWYTGEEKLETLTLIEELPGEIRGRKPPLWRADFGGWNKPTLYISPETGELVTRRHELWRVFDFFWMLHIMDYDERDNVNNTLLRMATVAATVMVLAGMWLLFYTLPFRRRRRRP